MKYPFCGSEDGYYEIEYVRRALYYNWDGAPDGATEDINCSVSKRKYCTYCKRILPYNMVKGLLGE